MGHIVAEEEVVHPKQDEKRKFRCVDVNLAQVVAEVGLRGECVPVVSVDQHAILKEDTPEEQYAHGYRDAESYSPPP